MQIIRRYAGALALFAVVATGLILARPHVNVATAAMAMVVVVMVVATAWGRRPALLIALSSSLCLNFFFIPPFYQWSIGEPQNWVAFAAFVFTALLIGQLSAREKART